MSLRCLIVDDSEDFLASAGSLLSAQGLEIVATATTGRAALRLTRRHQPDVVLVDVQLGEENGIELAIRLAATLGARVILISTHPEEDLVDLTADTPTLGFLAKSAVSVTAIRDLVASAPPDK